MTRAGWSSSCGQGQPRLGDGPRIGRGFIAFLSGMAEDERHRIVKGANEGRAVARKNRVRFGRKPKGQRPSAGRGLEAPSSGESCRSIAKKMGVHHATVARLAV